MEVITLRTEEGYRSAILLTTGPKYAQVVWADDRKPGVRVNKIPKHWLRYSAPLLRNGKPYNISRAKRMFRKMGRTLGITKSAKKALKAGS